MINFICQLDFATEGLDLGPGVSVRMLLTKTNI